jgi:hypothetical protein
MTSSDDSNLPYSTDEESPSPIKDLIKTIRNERPVRRFQYLVSQILFNVRSFAKMDQSIKLRIRYDIYAFLRAMSNAAQQEAASPPAFHVHSKMTIP